MTGCKGIFYNSPYGSHGGPKDSTWYVNCMPATSVRGRASCFRAAKTENLTTGLSVQVSHTATPLPKYEMHRMKVGPWWSMYDYLAGSLNPPASTIGKRTLNRWPFAPAQLSLPAPAKQETLNLGTRWTRTTSSLLRWPRGVGTGTVPP